ncbi:MAG: alpha/beta hydrolase [Clostridia bacterium]|nr:alpha/beta hydrolase [Clostridia bacterium]
MPDFVITFISIIGVLIVGILASSLYAYRRAFYSPKIEKRKTNSLDFLDKEAYKSVSELMKTLVGQVKAIPFEEVTIDSFDKTRLFARYYHMQDGAPLQIQFHGYRGSAFRDFCGGHALARELKHNILLVDQRAHGLSHGNSITFGIKESRDALAWCEYATRRFGNIPIFLVGVSMGGSTVIGASAYQLPSNVKGIIADCPFSSPRDIIKKVCGDMGLNPTLIYPFIKLGAILFGRFNPDSFSCESAVGSSSTPILILHGENDSFVPCKMSNKIYEKCKSKCFLYTFEGAEHGLSFLANPEKYKKAVYDFLNYCLE